MPTHQPIILRETPLVALGLHPSTWKTFGLSGTLVSVSRDDTKVPKAKGLLFDLNVERRSDSIASWDEEVEVEKSNACCLLVDDLKREAYTS
jgi:hypothetical protein